MKRKFKSKRCNCAVHFIYMYLYFVLCAKCAGTEATNEFYELCVE